jgi:hypothetical protein
MDANILVNIAHHDFHVWIAMSMVNKQLNTLLNIYECEKIFGRVVEYPNRKIRLLGGKLHSFDHPAIKWRNSNRREYYFKGLYHSYTHPALQYTRFDYNYQYWKVNGKLHRANPDGTVTEPAKIIYGGPIISRFIPLYEKLMYYKNGKLHRDGNMPAVVDNNRYGRGVEYWYEGKLHRDKFPAVITPDGWMYWYKHGLLHSPSPDHPATISKSRKGETKRWYWNGKPHRIGGPATVTANGGTVWFYEGTIHRGIENDPNYNGEPASEHREYKAWYRYGKLHRDGDLPAEIDRYGTRWYVNGELHRLTGPACMDTYSKRYYIHGVLLTEEEFNREIEIMNIYN